MIPNQQRNNTVVSSFSTFTATGSCSHQKQRTGRKNSLLTMAIGSVRIDPERVKVLIPELEQAPSLKLHKVDFQGDALLKFVDCLASNSNLQKLSLSNLDSKASNDLLCAILDHSAFKGLEELELSEMTLTKDIIHSLGTFFENNSNLITLRFDACNISLGTKFDQFAPTALKKSKKIRILQMSQCGLVDADFGLLLECLPESLETLILCRNQLRTLNVCQTTNIRHLRFVDLRENPLQPNAHNIDHLQILLELYPGLGRILLDNRSMTEKLRNLLDRNRSGGRLLLPQEVPLALWPFVVERINFRVEGWTPQQKSLAIYQLLQGPALMSRPIETFW